MTTTAPPLGEVPVLPPTHYCEDHEGSPYGGAACPRCVPVAVYWGRWRGYAMFLARRRLGRS